MEGWFLLLAGVGSIARSPVVGVKPDNPLAALGGDLFSVLDNCWLKVGAGGTPKGTRPFGIP